MENFQIKNQLRKFIKQERSERKLSKQILMILKKCRKMLIRWVIRTCVSLMALEDKDTKDNYQANMRKAMRILLKHRQLLLLTLEQGKENQ